MYFTSNVSIGKGQRKGVLGNVNLRVSGGIPNMMEYEKMNGKHQG